MVSLCLGSLPLAVDRGSWDRNFPLLPSYAFSSVSRPRHDGATGTRREKSMQNLSTIIATCLALAALGFVLFEFVARF